MEKFPHQIAVRCLKMFSFYLNFLEKNTKTEIQNLFYQTKSHTHVGKKSIIGFEMFAFEKKYEQ